MEERLLLAFRKLPLAEQKRKLWLIEYSASAYAPVRNIGANEPEEECSKISA